MQEQWSAEDMFDALGALGGTAENIHVAETGELSARDPGQPIVLRIPENLVIPLGAFEVAEGSLRLGNGEAASPAVRDFLGRYENRFGRLIFARATAAVDALDSLSAQLKGLLVSEFGMREVFEGDRARRIEHRFVESRTIWRGDERVLTPVLELARHDPKGLAIHFGGGIKISGSSRNGISVFHPFHDAIAIFERFGFAVAQPAAFSLPMGFDSDGVNVAIGRNLQLGERRGEVTVPQLNVIGRNSLELSHLMIGHSGFPRLPRGIFRSRMRDADVKDPDWQFDRILQENSARLLKLLGVLEGEEGETINLLRRTAHHQLEAMSSAIGAREL